MKTLIKLFTSTLMMIFLFTNQSLGQGTVLRLNRTISLSGDSEMKNIKLEVKEKTMELHINIKSIVTEGRLSIEIYNPNGKKQGNFSVGSQWNSKASSGEYKDKKMERVNGQIEKRVKAPVKGNWIIKIIPNKTKGSISISSKQVYKDN